jgi:hypothetical protein
MGDVGWGFKVDDIVEILNFNFVYLLHAGSYAEPIRFVFPVWSTWQPMTSHQQPATSNQKPGISMSKIQKPDTEYQGFEQGPIRPPSEAASLLIRVTRNCPWNRCSFCPVYKGARFSLRPVAHVKRDIDTVHRHIETIRRLASADGTIRPGDIHDAAERSAPGEIQALNAAIQWHYGGMRSIFLQDANSLIIKPADLVAILEHLKTCFPWVERVTSYARSHTIARIKDEELKAIAQAGLNRIHIGLESGSDLVLKLVQKGADKATHIKAGKKVKSAGMELSEYVMPGLGGKNHSDIHAVETADALNRINPDFIRLRTLAIPDSAPLYAHYEAGRFHKCTDLEMAREILLFLETLGGITSNIRSDHILNLFQDVEGKLPEDKPRMIAILHRFLEMRPEEQTLYQVGRRLNVFATMDDMDNPRRLARVQRTCDELGITPANVDELIDELMKRFI